MNSISNSNARPCPLDKKVFCDNCRLNSICLPNQIVQRGKPLKKGEYPYRANDPFTAVFAIRSGAVKAFSLNDNGNEQITGFYLPGKVVGMHGIAENRYTNSVIALDTASVCEIPFPRMEELSLQVPGLQ